MGMKSQTELDEIEKLARELCEANGGDPEERVTFDVPEYRPTPYALATVVRRTEPLWHGYIAMAESLIRKRQTD